MVWGGFGHMAVVLFFPAIGIRLRIFQDYEKLGSDWKFPSIKYFSFELHQYYRVTS